MPRVTLPLSTRNSSIFSLSSCFSQSLSPSRLLSTSLSFVAVISSSPFSPVPRWVGHRVTSSSPHTHTCILNTLYECECVCVCVGEQEGCECMRESALALNFHFNQHVGERTILLPQGRTEGPLHNLSLLSVSHRLSRSLPPSLSHSETTN